jgi:hypothetical protein
MGGIASTKVTLKTSTIRTRARIQILVQCHQMFGNNEALRHESEAGSLGFGVHRAYSGVGLPVPVTFSNIEAPRHSSEAGSLRFDVH